MATLGLVVGILGTVAATIGTFVAIRVSLRRDNLDARLTRESELRREYERGVEAGVNSERMAHLKEQITYDTEHMRRRRGDLRD